MVRIITFSGAVIISRTASSSFHQINGELQKLIEVSGVPVGVLYKGNFYPAIIDHRMAVVGLLNTDGSAIKFLRHQDAWGNLENVTGDRAFEKQIAFGYARLMQNPLAEQVTKTKFYFSGTRVYSPAMGEWMSPDATVVWNPEKLINNPGNWDPFKYANNDPLNFVDENGRFVNVLIGAAVGAGIGYINARVDKTDTYKGILVGAITGAAISSGAGLATMVSTSLMTQVSLVSFVGFSSSLVAQFAAYGKVDVTDAIVAGAVAPIGLTYGNLFKGLPKLLAHATADMSFMSIDLLVGFSVKKLKSTEINKVTTSANASNSYSFGNYNFKHSYMD